MPTAPRGLLIAGTAVAHEVWITGYGLVSSLGERDAEWWPRLQDPASHADVIDSETYAPFHVHPAVELDLSAQIPKPGDQRAMGPMMHYGVYAAGVALDAAGIKGDEGLLLETDLLAASGGGERDYDVDRAALDLLAEGEAANPELNRYLSDNLRPTLFLAQLPNLFAGNISIVHGVAGSSRTFMGEESAGIDAVRIGYERISAGQGELFLVGGGFNGERGDYVFMFHAGGMLLSESITPLWRRPDAGMCLGSAGAFVVLEQRAHAEARGAAPLARLNGVKSARCRRTPGAAAAGAQAQWEALRPALREAPLAVMSGASGVGPLTREEHAFLAAIADSGVDLAVRGTAAALGHTLEAAFIANMILGVSCLAHGEIFPPLAPDDPLESRLASTPVEQVLITGWGNLRGEGMALMEAVNG